MRARRAWWVYQLLCAFFALGSLVSICLWFWRGNIGETLQHATVTHWLCHGARVVLLVGSIAALARREWAARLVAISGIWVVASGWTWVPGLIDEVILDIRYPPFPLESLPFVPRLSLYIFVGAALLDVVLASALVVAAHSVSRGTALNGEHQARGGVCLPLGAILLLGAGLVLKRLVLHGDNATYVMAIGSWLVVGGCILSVIWQVQLKKLFVAAWAVGFAGVLFLVQPALGSTALTVGLWLPALGLGIGCLLLADYPRPVRAFGLIVPVVLAGTAVAAPWVDIPMFLHFSAYADTLKERPGDFPAVLVAPDNAESIAYSAAPICRQAPHTYSVYFSVRDPYPSDGTRWSLREYLQGKGWQRLKYQLLNPTVPLSKDPLASFLPSEEPNSVPPEEQGRDRPVVWHEDWVNERDEHISILLSYDVSVTTREVTRDKVYVTLSFFDQKSWIRPYVERYREIHPDEFDRNSSTKVLNEP